MDKALLVLASASERRAALLRQLQLSFRVAAQQIDESPRQHEPPSAHVQRLAREKAQAGWRSGTDGLPVVGADTIVVQGQAIYGKPANRSQALKMLGHLSGRAHRVMTAVTVVQGEKMESAVSESQVRFRPISQAEMIAYWDSGEPVDKAGAYAIQGLGGMFVEELRGSYSGVVGLPLYETAQLLSHFGIKMLNPQGSQA